MEKQFNWGIIGLGNIARKFAEALTVIPETKLYAVASRSLDKAKEFAEKYSAEVFYGAYSDLINDKNIDAVYIATPHSHHMENTLDCLNNKIPVLCEKPMAVNAFQVKKMIESAHANNTFLMEAIWTRFLPNINQVLEIIESGEIGSVKMMSVDFGFKAPYLPEKRLYNPELAGGSLLDIGIYPLFLVSTILGWPSEVQAMANIGKTGVDEECLMNLRYPDDKMASIFSTITADTRTNAEIYGNEGRIIINRQWFRPSSVEVWKHNEKINEFPAGNIGNGYNYEAVEVMKCVGEGKTESSILPLDFSLKLMELMDEIRRQIGLKYPLEGEQ